MILVPRERIYLQGLTPAMDAFYLEFLDFGDSDEVVRAEIVDGDQVVPKDSIPASSREYSSSRVNTTQKDAFKSLVHTYLGKLVRIYDYPRLQILEGLVKSYEVRDGNRGNTGTYVDNKGETQDIPLSEFSLDFVFEAYSIIPILKLTKSLPGAYNG